MTNEERLIITKYDLMFESRLTKVECGQEELKQDFKEMKRILYGIMGIGITSIIIPILLRYFGIK